MFEFVDRETGLPNKQLNDFTGAPSEDCDELIDFVSRMPDWKRLDEVVTTDEPAAFQRRDGLVVALQKQE